MFRSFVPRNRLVETVTGNEWKCSFVQRKVSLPLNGIEDMLKFIIYIYTQTHCRRFLQTCAIEGRKKAGIDVRTFSYHTHLCLKHRLWFKETESRQFHYIDGIEKIFGSVTPTLSSTFKKRYLSLLSVVTDSKIMKSSQFAHYRQIKLCILTFQAKNFK